MLFPTFRLIFLTAALAGFVSSVDTLADEASPLAKLEAKVEKPRITKDKEGRIIQIAVNGPDFSNEDLALFNGFPHLQKLTISHAGYARGKKTGVDYSGVALLKDHPSLEFFSAGGAVGKEYLAALPALTNISELYIQTTSSVDEDWAPIGEMDHLVYLGIRVRNGRMNQLTEGFFEHIEGLENLERFLLGEMTFKDFNPFLDLLATYPKLSELTLRRCEIPEGALDRLKARFPKLVIEVVD